MSLRRLGRHWNRFATTDAFWAVLTDPRRRDHGWTAEEFFRTGEDEIASVLGRAAPLGVALPRRRALDFGCGVGRLTQALATRFATCDGVDIAPAMVRQARELNRHPNCRYHRNTAPDLRLFEDAAFDFVYSVLVLQHMPPGLARVYVGEFLRVLAPGGLLVFQVPSHRSVEEPPASAPRTTSRSVLPASAMRARITPRLDAGRSGPGADVTVEVEVENLGTAPWPCRGDADAGYQVQLGNHWLAPDGEMRRADDGRCPLPFDLAPGDKAVLLLSVTAPDEDGPWVLELDMVQEDVLWFAERGSATARVGWTVEGGRPRVTRPARGRGEPLIARLVGLQRRFPGLHRRAKQAGLLVPYWWLRRGLDAAQRALDTNHVRARLRRRLGRRVPVMQMNCIPRGEVVALVEGAGGRVLDIEQELVPGGFQSCRYWVTRER